MDIEDLFLRYCARSFDKQMALSEVLGDDNHEWAYNMDSGKITFNNKLAFDTQIVGTESDISNTWLWAWANVESGIPERLLKVSLMLKQVGAEQQIPALTNAEVTLTDAVNGHRFAMIASGIYKADAYYRGPYDGGAIFVLIKDDTFLKPKEHPIQRIALKFPQFIMQTPISSHFKAFGHYLKSYDLDVVQDGRTVTGKHPDGKAVTATFDAQQRLAELKTTLGGA